MRSSITRSQWISARMSRTEHRVLDRDPGIVRTQLHRSARLEIVGLSKHALVVWLEQSPRFAREKLGKPIALGSDESLDGVRNRIETGSRRDASRLRNRQRRI